MESGQRDKAFVFLLLEKLQAVHFLHVQPSFPGAGQHTVIKVNADVSDAVFIQDFQPLSAAAADIGNHPIRIACF